MPSSQGAKPSQSSRNQSIHVQPACHRGCRERKFYKGVSQDVAETYEWDLLDVDQYPEIDAEEAVQIEAAEALCDAEGELWGVDTEDEEFFQIPSTAASCTVMHS